MKLFITLALIFAIASSFALTSSQQANDDKVLVELYYESLCPYCQQFITGSLSRAFKTADIWSISDFRLYPYGNAKPNPGATPYPFTCQHGVRECEGNIIEACAIAHNDWYTKALPFIICLEKNSTNWSAAGQTCANQLGINWTEINTCATSQEGINLHTMYGTKTNNLDPVHQYVPWIVVNGAHSPADESAVETDYVKFVCGRYKGTVKIAACK